MKAAVLYRGESHLRVEDRPSGDPGPGQVKVRVECCGVCGSDLHITVHKIMALKEYPRIPGHESSGVVASVGQGVTRVAPGDPVVIGAGTSCGTCAHCLAGHENLCPDIGVLGFDRDGAFAEEIIVPDRYLHKIPDGIPFDQAAILADAVSTPYHALRYRGGLQPGETVAVFGCGGLGIHAVALARVLGAGKVVALDVDPGALAHAAQFGAHETIDVRSVKNPGKALKEVTGGCDLICDFSGHLKNIEESLRALNTGGRVVMVGIGKGALNFNMPQVMIFRQLSVCGSYGCDQRAIPELLDLLGSGRLNLDRSITSRHPLTEVNDCLENLYHRRGNPIRYIITPGK